MEYIDGSIIGHDRSDVPESGKEEFVECLIAHVIILDFPGAALIVYIVGRVGDHEVGLRPGHQ